MKKSLIIVIIVLAVVYVFSLLDNEEQNEKLKIGIIMPLSGPAASAGEDLGRTIGFTESRVDNIEFEIQDDQCLPKNAISAYTLMKNQGIKVFLTACSGSVLSLAPLAKEDGNLIITAYAGSIDIRDTGTEVIRFNPDGLAISDGLIEEIQKDIDTKYGLLYAQQDYPQSVTDKLKEVAGDQIVFEEPYSTEQVEFRTHLTKLGNADIDEIIFIPIPDEQTAETIYKEMNELGINKPIVGEANVCDLQTQPADFGLTGYCLKAELDTPGYHTFIREFTSEYETNQTYPFFNALTYDTLLRLDQLLEDEDEINNETIDTLKVEFLKGFEGQTANFEFTENGELTETDYFVKVEF